MSHIHVTVWNEYLHEVQFPEIAEIYPNGIHGCIAAFLQKEGFDVRTATLRMSEHGLTAETLDSTDVLIWWGHMAHHEVSDEVVQRVHRRILEGMGLIVLHSGHASKIFKTICGTHSEMLKWREDGRREILWVVDPSHPLPEGLRRKSSFPPKRCTESISISPRPMNWCLLVGSRAEKCSAAVAVTVAARGRSSISSPGTKPFRYTTRRRFNRLLRTLYGGRLLPVHRKRPTAIRSPWWNFRPARHLSASKVCMNKSRRNKIIDKKKISCYNTIGL